MGRLGKDFSVRFVWAVAAFVLAALMIGAGIAQRTVFQGPTTQSASAVIDSDARYRFERGVDPAGVPGARNGHVELPLQVPPPRSLGLAGR